MSGHSKWATIKRAKASTDAKKGKLLTKASREIMLAVKQGGPDPAGNSKLREAIVKAKAASMPNDSIQRSIKKAAGDQDSANYEEIVYEGYGPGGVAIIVEAATDNRNRTAGDVRHLFDKCGGNLGALGCVSFMFDRKGIIIIEKTTKIDEENLMAAAIEAGADDFTIEEEYFEVTTSPDNFSAVHEMLEKAGYSIESAEVQRVPQTYVELTDPKQAEMMEKLIDSLEDLDDVQNVFHNWEQ